MTLPNSSHSDPNHTHTPLLQVQHLSVSFLVGTAYLKAVDDVSFDVYKGEIIGIVGESGCGKSVTAMSILRLLPIPPAKIEQGSIRFQGVDLLTLPLKELRNYRGKEIGVIFQDPMTALSPLQPIGEQVMEVIQIHYPSLPSQKVKEQALYWLKHVGIPEVEERFYAYPFQFSGGMRQRVMIACAMVLQPQLLIADEPTTALDVTIQAQIFQLMKKLQAEQGSSVILITHDMGVVAEMCNRVLVMYASQIVETGPTPSLFTQPLHPYTLGLLRSIPHLDLNLPSGSRLPSIPGQVPSPFQYPAGCHFADRCPFVLDQCRKKKPDLVHVQHDRSVRCFRAEEFLTQYQKGIEISWPT